MYIAPLFNRVAFFGIPRIIRLVVEPVCGVLRSRVGRFFSLVHSMLLANGSLLGILFTMEKGTIEYIHYPQNSHGYDSPFPSSYIYYI